MMGETKGSDKRDAGEMAAIGGLYRLLAQLWLCEIETELLSQLRSGVLAEAFREHHFFSPGEKVDATALAEDYRQLLISPPDHLSPHQSVWDEGPFASRAIVSMKRYLQLFKGPLPHREAAADHLGNQLAIMGEIAAEIAAEMAATNPQGSRYASLEALGSEFFVAHLLWPATFLARAGRQAKTQFYQVLCHLTADFLVAEAGFWKREGQAGPD